MQTITVSHTISMGHRLPSYQGDCASPHGHNVRFEVEIEVPKGKFLDFKQVKGRLIDLIGQMDHAMVLHVDDPLLPVLEKMEFRVYPTLQEPTTEHIAQFVWQYMVTFYDVSRVTVHETDKYSASYGA